MLPRAVVVDANVVLSALIGGRARLVFASPLGPKCFAAEEVAEEIAEHLPKIARRRGLDAGPLLAALAVIPVKWEQPGVYQPFRDEAKRRMARRDPDDWPTVALALARSIPIWSQDKDMEAANHPTYTTGDLLDALSEAETGQE